jgi:LPXTG-motif cell wall-anchored protein
MAPAGADNKAMMLLAAAALVGAVFIFGKKRR